MVQTKGLDQSRVRVEAAAPSVHLPRSADSARCAGLRPVLLADLRRHGGVKRRHDPQQKQKTAIIGAQRANSIHRT
jgi:hypothetical protein